MKRTLLLLIASLALFFQGSAQSFVMQGDGLVLYRGILCVDVVSNQIVWATAYDGSPTGATTVNDFTMTTNGGTSWTAGSVLGGTTYGLGNISAISATTAWVALYNGVGNQDNSCGVYKTTDGGTTWAQQPGALQGANSFADNVYFWDANDGMCHGDVNGGYFEIYTTSNGGSTWTRVPQANINATVATGEGGWTGVINAVGDSTIAFGTNKSKVYVSNDRGHHWFAKPTGLLTTGNNAGVNEIKFTTPLHGLAAHATTTNSFQIAETFDGGNTWTLVTTTGTLYSASLGVAPGTNTFFASGAAQNYSGFTYSFDGGHTWAEFLAQSGTQMLAQDWLNDSTGWVGTFVQDPPNDGMFKWEGVFALPNANFIASDSNLTLGSTVTYTNLTGSATSYAWTFDGGSPGTFTGKTPPPITYNSPGTFNTRLIATNSFGPDTLLKTGYIHVGGVGINEVPYASVTIYPNPAHGMLKVKTSDNVEAVQLFNLVGQVVVDQTMDSKEFSLNIEGLNPGVYTLKLTIGEKPYIRKIVVN